MFRILYARVQYCIFTSVQKGMKRMEFTYFTPAKVIFGKDCIRKNPSAMAGLGKKALIVSGHHAAKATGALDDCIAALSANGQQYEVYDKVTPNPTVDVIYEGAGMIESEGCDFVLCIGGGSPMDAGKAMALIAAQKIPAEELFAGHYTMNVLPIVAVPTTAGTGSEVTKASIITNDAAKTKSSITFEGIFPKVAYCDSRYLGQLNHKTQVNTVVDALSHALEGFLAKKASPVSDVLAGTAIRLITPCLKDLKEGTVTSEENDQLLLASTLAGMVIANTGTTAGHGLGYSLTYFRHIDHGRANGLVLPALFRFYEKKGVSKLYDALAFMGMKEVREFTDCIDGLMGDRETFTDDELKQYTEIAAKSGNVKNGIIPVNKEEILSIYRDAFS